MSAGAADLRTLISQLPEHEFQQAVEYFKVQRRRWLAVRTASSNYTIKTRVYQNGEFVDLEEYPQFGKLELVVHQYDQPHENERYIGLQIRMSDDRWGVAFATDDYYDRDALGTVWPLQGEKIRRALPDVRFSFRENALIYQVFMPLVDVKARSFNDGNWSRPNNMNEEEYMAELGVPLRKTTDAERNELFNGEPQYLFMPKGIAKGNLWFSGDTGELRQIDADIDAGRRITIRYEQYVSDAKGEASLPTRVIYRVFDRNNHPMFERTIVLSNTGVNAKIGDNRFVPGDRSISLSQP